MVEFKSHPQYDEELSTIARVRSLSPRQWEHIVGMANIIIKEQEELAEQERKERA